MDSNDERLEVGALSETGYTREENQDRMSGAQVPLGHLYIVADGMGGHKGGALAAQMAVEELQRHIGQAPAGESADAVIEAAFKAANDAVYKRSSSGDATVAGMGTTAVLALILGRVAKLAHVGDSRAYLYRNHRLSQLTTDHTIVQRMVEAGMLKPDEAADHPQSSVLERAIGSAPTVGVDIRNHQLEEGDALLLCSDGLSGYVAADKIEAVLRADGPVQDTTISLVRLALEAGGRDNVTVQLIRYGARRIPAPAMRTRPLPTLPPSAPTVGGGPARREPRLIRKLAAFVMAGGAVAITAGLIGYFIGIRTTANVNQLRQPLDSSDSAKGQVDTGVKDPEQQGQKSERLPDAARPSDNATMHQPPGPAPTGSPEEKKTGPGDGTSQTQRKGDSILKKRSSKDAGKPPASPLESSKLPSSTGKGPSNTDKAPSSTDKGTSSTDKETSSTGKGTSNTDKAPSSTDTGTSSTDKETSSTGKGPSNTDKAPSNTDKAPSNTDKAPSSTNKGTSSTDQGTSSTDKGTPSTDKGASRVPDEAQSSSVAPPTPPAETSEASKPTGQPPSEPAPDR